MPVYIEIFKGSTQQYQVCSAYLIFVTNAANAVRVKSLAQCKKISEEQEKYCFWQFCRKFTHFPSVKFS